MWRYGMIKKNGRAGGAGTVAETRISEGVEGKPGGGKGWWTDGHAKGARGCATTTPQPPANSAAARRSARSTGSNATTAYNTSPSRSPAVYLAAATLLRSARFLCSSLSSLSSSCSSSPAADSHTPPLSFTCVHTRGMMLVSSLILSFSSHRGWLRAGTRAERDSHQAEANRAVLFRVMKLPRRNATSRRPRQRRLRRPDTLANRRDCGTLKFLHGHVNTGN